jgi:hypothetical protein
MKVLFRHEMGCLMTRTLKALVLLTLMIAGCMTAGAVTTTYSTQASFDAATGHDYVTVTFEGLASGPTGHSTTLNECFAASTGPSCIVINGRDNNDSGFQSMYITDSSNRTSDPLLYDWGSGDQVQGSYCCISTAMSHDEFVPTTNTSEFGIDLMTIQGYAGQVNICVFTVGNSEGTCFNGVNTQNYSTEQFWGITTGGDLITKVTIGSNGQPSNHYLLFDNVEYQAPAGGTNPIPEPASLVLFGSGVLTAASALRKNLAKKK